MLSVGDVVRVPSGARGALVGSHVLPPRSAAGKEQTGKSRYEQESCVHKSTDPWSTEIRVHVHTANRNATRTSGLVLHKPCTRFHLRLPDTTCGYFAAVRESGSAAVQQKTPRRKRLGL